MTKSPQDTLSGYPEQRLEGLRRAMPPSCDKPP